MRVIFLDIDGVLNPGYHMNALNIHAGANKIPRKDEFGYLFCPHTVENLKRVIDLSGAQIVISSTWRMSGLSAMQTMWEFRDLPGEVIDITPYWGMPRGEEIAGWLSENQTDSYVIIDDDGDMLPEQAANFIKTDGRYGLKLSDAERCISILNN